MPTVLLARGWRLFFYANEGNEPMHIHARKGEAECKFWLYPDRFDISLEFEFNCSPPMLREIRKLIYDNFEDLCDAWREWFSEK